MVEILKGPSLTKHQNPKKLMIMLHGYGDNATNFIQIANLIDQDDFEMKYVALNAPDTIQDYPMGYEWFQLCLLYTSPSPRDRTRSRMPSSA